MGKKELLANLLYHSGLWRPVSKWRRHGLVILNYHRIRPDHATEACPFDGGVFGPTQSTFERQVKWLKAHFEVLSESEVLGVVRGADGFRGRYAAITFDDGYRDNYDRALPVLNAHNTPAIFFICPAIIEDRLLGWWDIIAFLVKASHRAAIHLRGETIPLDGQKPAAIGKLTAWMKLRPATETAGLMDELAEVCGVPLPGLALRDRQLMTWDQIREASRGRIAIGSHTHTHRVLAGLTEEDQRWELTQSKAALETQLGRPVRTLAYPVGGYQNFTAVTMRLARDCGYEGAFSFHTGVNLPGDGNPYNLRRIAPSDTLDAMFACGAALPEMFSWSHPLPASHRTVAPAAVEVDKEPFRPA
jgi:peptidoglycan/xylan/chitin deacetylase (PgdA/CDA1 family)